MRRTSTIIDDFPDAWIQHLNWLGEMPPPLRSDVRVYCAARGHEPSPEQLPVADPILICVHCGSRYRDPHDVDHRTD